MPFRPPMWIISNKRQLNTWCGWSYHHLPLDHDTESSVDAVLVLKGSSRFRGTTRTCASPGAEDSRPATPLLINDHSSSLRSLLLYFQMQDLTPDRICSILLVSLTVRMGPRRDDQQEPPSSLREEALAFKASVGQSSWLTASTASALL